MYVSKSMPRTALGAAAPAAASGGATGVALQLGSRFGSVGRVDRVARLGVDGLRRPSGRRLRPVIGHAALVDPAIGLGSRRTRPRRAIKTGIYRLMSHSCRMRQRAGAEVWQAL